MAVLKNIIETLAEDTALKLVAQTYSELSLTKLQRIRLTIERNRNFAREVAQVYYLVKAMAPKAADPRKQKPKGTISLLLVSNSRFYGGLEEQLIKLYASHTPEFETDRIIIGKTATEYLAAIKYRYPFEGMFFKEDLPTTEELAGLIDKINGYQRVFVYYPRFQTVLVQQPTFTDLTGPSALTTAGASSSAFYYIFEPEVEKMLVFIDRQIIALLLEQSFLEAELARTAARLVAMEQAQSNAETMIAGERKQLARARRQLADTKLLEMVLNITMQKNIKNNFQCLKIRV
ncbi:MAG: FoF1 ATP synthase subunit gamma [Patescibacteria group bacterium]